MRTTIAMMVPPPQVLKAILRGDRMPEGDERIRAYAEAVQIADQLQDLEAGFLAREDLIQSAVFGGRPDLALVPFAWCLAQSDADPKRFPADRARLNPLWIYKWIIEQAAEHPEISRDKLEELLEDMSRRYSAHGGSLRSISKLRLQGALSMFDHERVPSLLQRWEEGRRDRFTDCGACDVDCAASAQLSLGRLREARATAKRIFEGKLSCAEVPTVTYGSFIVPLWLGGQSEDASRLGLQLPRLIGKNRAFTMAAGATLVYLHNKGSKKALKLAKKYAGWALTGDTPLRRLPLLIGLVHVFRRQCDSGYAEEQLAGLAKDETPTTYRKALSRFEHEALSLAVAFDRRNGHSRVGENVRARLDRVSSWGWPF